MIQAFSFYLFVFVTFCLLVAIERSHNTKNEFVVNFTLSCQHGMPKRSFFIFFCYSHCSYFIFILHKVKIDTCEGSSE